MTLQRGVSNKVGDHLVHNRVRLKASAEAQRATRPTSDGVDARRAQVPSGEPFPEAMGE
jgi:hypothetical protein